MPLSWRRHRDMVGYWLRSLVLHRLFRISRSGLAAFQGLVGNIVKLGAPRFAVWSFVVVAVLLEAVRCVFQSPVGNTMISMAVDPLFQSPVVCVISKAVYSVFCSLYSNIVISEAVAHVFWSPVVNTVISALSIFTHESLHSRANR